MNNLKDIHNTICKCNWIYWLFYQDFNEQFEGYTQRASRLTHIKCCCFIRISMNNLKDIHNLLHLIKRSKYVVLSGFQWTIWRIYTTDGLAGGDIQSCFIRISMNNLKDIHNVFNAETKTYAVVLSGFQWTIWRIYTTSPSCWRMRKLLFYQDFNEQFEGYTQQLPLVIWCVGGCFIRISMNNLKDIHNLLRVEEVCHSVVLSGFQWTIWRIYTTYAL